MQANTPRTPTNSSNRLTQLQNRFMTQSVFEMSQIQLEDNRRLFSKSQLFSKSTDSRLFVIFIFIITFLFVLSVVTIAIYDGFKHIGRWKHGSDSDGNICGFGQTSQYPFIYLYNPQYINQRICVKDCNQQSECYLINGVKSCQQSINIMDQAQQFILYESINYQDSICIPTSVSYYKQEYQAFEMNMINLTLSDIWQLKFILILIFIFITILRKYIDNNIIIIIFAMGIIIGFGGIYFFSLFTHVQDQNQLEKLISNATINNEFIQQHTNSPNKLILLIVSFLMIISFFLICIGIHKYFDQIEPLYGSLLIIKSYLNRVNLTNSYVIKFVIIKFILIFLYFLLISYIMSGFTDITQDLPLQSVQYSILQYFMFIINLTILGTLLSLCDEIHVFILIYQQFKYQQNKTVEFNSKYLINYIGSLIICNYTQYFQFKLDNHSIYIKIIRRQINFESAKQLIKEQSFTPPFQQQNKEKLLYYYTKLNNLFWGLVGAVILEIIQKFTQIPQYSTYPGIIIIIILCYQISKSYSNQLLASLCNKYNFIIFIVVLHYIINKRKVCNLCQQSINKLVRRNTSEQEKLVDSMDRQLYGEQ